MNVLGLDIGDSRIGIAFGNTKSKISSPIKVLSPAEILNKSRDFQLILQDYQPEKFIFGLPKSLQGQENDQSAHVREMAEKISNLYDIPAEFVDERLSSAEAKRILHEQGLNEKQMRGKIDSVAAAIFLETYLNS